MPQENDEKDKSGRTHFAASLERALHRVRSFVVESYSLLVIDPADKFWLDKFHVEVQNIEVKRSSGGFSTTDSAEITVKLLIYHP